MFLLRRLLVLRRRGGWRVRFRGVVYAEGEGSGRADGDDARAEFDADGDIVVWGEAAFAEADGELRALGGWQWKEGEMAYTGLSATGVA